VTDDESPDGSDEPTVDEPVFREPSLDDETAQEILDTAFDESSAVPDASPEATGGERESDASETAIDTDAEPEPEDALSEPFAEERSLGAEEQATLRETYGYVRAYFKARPDRYRRLQRHLKQARVRDTYDEYLTASVRFAVIAGIVGGLLGNVVVAVVGLTTGLDVFDPLYGIGGVVGGVGRQTGADAFTPFFGLGRALIDFFAANPLVAAALLVPAIGTVAGGVLVWVGRNYYYPRSVVAARRRSITLNLPYAITFMYALSSGGMNFVEVCRRLGERKAVYGEVANEFDLVVREIDLFGNDLLQALNNVRTLTPSDELRRFLDDLLGVLESGGDLEAFLEEESETYLDTAIDEQESFIETLGALSEVFVVAFVAAPLFLIVVLMVVSFLGAQTLSLIGALIYLVFPLAMAAFLLVVDLLSRPYEEPTAELKIDDERRISTDQVADDPRFPAHRRTQQETGLRAFLSDPFRAIRRRPVLSLGLTVPGGLIVTGFLIWLGWVDPTVSGFLTAPIRTTVGIAVVPLITATGPLTLLHERERRRTNEITERFPDVLSILASANRMGVDIVDGFDLVTRWANEKLAGELGRVRNDIAWNHDLQRALYAFAARLNVPQLTRTMTLIAEGSRSSGDLGGLLEVAADDTRARAKLARARRSEVGSYVAIVVVGFLVYLLVIVMVGESYLTPIAELAADQAPASTQNPVGLGSIPVDTYRLLFLHSALIQGFGSGLIAGKLADNTVLSGLKFGLGLVGLTIAAFVLLV